MKTTVGSSGSLKQRIWHSSAAAVGEAWAYIFLRPVLRLTGSSTYLRQRVQIGAYKTEDYLPQIPPLGRLNDINTTLNRTGN